LRPYRDDREAVLRVASGQDGTCRIDDELPVDAAIRAPVLTVMGLMAGVVAPKALLSDPEVQVEGNVERLSYLPLLFEMNL